jgi:membrane fusion protein, multidrug efflux system
MDERIDRTEVDRTERESPATARPRTRRRHPWRWAALLVVFLAIGALLWRQVLHAPQPGGRGGPSGAAPPQSVGAASVDQGDIRVILSQLGTVTPLANVTVKTQISGQLMEVGFNEGQLVRKGDFLAQVDDRPYQVALERDLGQLAHDQGTLDQARHDLKRYETLGRQDSIALQQLDDQKFLVEQLIGTVQATQGAVDTDKLNIAYCHIIAPVTGRVGLRQVDPGNYVQTTDANGLVVLTELDPISVIFTIPQDNIPEVMRQLTAGISLPVDAYDRANTQQLAAGKVETVDNQIDTTTGTVRVRANFANPQDVLFPNQFVNAHLLVDTLHNVVRVPVAAVQQGAPGPYVYVINPDDTVSVRPIKVGPVDGAVEQVVSGLKPGERVVTDGTDRLRDGAKVTVPQASNASGANPPPRPPRPRGRGGSGQ